MKRLWNCFFILFLFLNLSTSAMKSDPLSNYQFYIFDEVKLSQLYEQLKGVAGNHNLLIPIVDTLISDIEKIKVESVSDSEMHIFFVNHSILDFDLTLDINYRKLENIKTKLKKSETLLEWEVKDILLKASIRYCSPLGDKVWPFEESVFRISQSLAEELSDEIVNIINNKTVIPTNQNIDKIYFLFGLDFADYSIDEISLLREFFPKYSQMTFSDKYIVNGIVNEKNIIVAYTD